jgi:hypothetical protein
MNESNPSSATQSLGFQLQGISLFLFIPLVLFFFVRHPEPLALWIPLACVIMIGHRSLARPYAAQAVPIKCIWCNRVLPRSLDSASASFDLAAGGIVVPVRTCRQHARPASRFFRFLWAGRLPFRIGIFIPLLLLLVSLGKGIAGDRGWIPLATVVFQLAVALTVNFIALGPWMSAKVGNPSPIPVPFPLHNFYLLGVRTLLWLFRLVGLWWVLVVFLHPWPAVP